MLSAYLSPADIKVNLESSEKEECFAELLELIVAKNPKIKRPEAMKALIEREEKMSTAVFPCIAVPHALSKDVGDIPAIAIGISPAGIEFEPVSTESDPKASQDNPKVNIIFEILFEEKEAETHLRILRDIVSIVSNPDFTKSILQAKTSQEVYDLIEFLES